MKTEAVPTVQNEGRSQLETVPEGWALTKLGEIVCPSTERIEPSECPDALYLGLEHVESHTGRIIGHGYGRDAQSTKAIFHAGDVLYGKLRPYLNKVSIPEFDGICSTDFLVFPQVEWLDSRLLRWYLLRQEVVQYANHHSSGVELPRVSFEALANLDFALPSLAEQKRIVGKIEDLLTRVNSARERLDRVPVILERFREAVLVAGCSGRLTENWRDSTEVEPLESTLKRVKFVQTSTGRAATDNVIPGQCILSVGHPATDAPEGWRWLPICGVARLESGHTPSRKHPEYWIGEIPWIGIRDAAEHDGRVITDTFQHVSQAGLDNSSARLLPSGTVCLSRTASVGYVVIMGRPMATSQDFVNWICSEAIDKEFLMFALKAEGESIRRFGRGTTHTTIYFPEVKALHICLPPIAEQREIVRRIRSMLSSADAVEKHVALATACNDRLTQTIFAKAFRGELVPTEAELAELEGRDYESASALRERIRSTKIEQSSSSRLRKRISRAG
jgi:type I restriction enzyme S subunit